MRKEVAQPIKIRDIHGHFDVDNGVVGYQFEVLFRGKDIPVPFYGRVYHSVYYEHFNQTQAVYLFPFIGYGLINIAKISATRFHKKLKEQLVQNQK